ncbi:hypothetical protein [Methylobacter sp.]|uniref:hypothetical protein n=1 Tax=Methylobacter sp. TaxID=2051955 RepID=UPI0012047033|nr:hypothetical protein [Methylobacter sp.]TAK62744.1 MAG: hypothetical protein EPO18_09535 [Methylobacter sp.]
MSRSHAARAHRYTQLRPKVVTPEIVIQRHACLGHSRREKVTFETSRLFRKRCQLDLPGFKNLEGLYIGMFLAYR